MYKKRRIMRKLNLIKPLVLLFSILLLAFSNFVFVSADTSWWNSSFMYRIPLNTSWNSSDITNLTANLEINSSVMGDKFDFVEDRDSLRFVYYNGSSNIEISHYAESWNNVTNHSEIMLLIPFLEENKNNSLWIYYGNNNVSNKEDYCSVFIYCDDFEDGIIDSRLLTVDRDTVSGTIFDEGLGVFNLTAGGNDIWTGSDHYGAGYIENIEGDLDVSLRIMSQGDPNGWAKAGIGFKNDMTLAGSSTGYAVMVVTPSNAYSFQRDIDNNGYLDVNTNAGGSSVYPSYVRMTKIGNSFSGYYGSPSSWNLVGTQSISSVNSVQDVSMIVTSHAGSTLSKVLFDDFIIKRYSSNVPKFYFGENEQLVGEVEVDINYPSNGISNFVLQNDSLKFNATVSCLGLNDASCYNLSIVPRYNVSLVDYDNVSMVVGTTPVYSMSSDPLYCDLDVGESCSVEFELNFTGEIDSFLDVNVFAQSNNSDVKDGVSDNWNIWIVNSDIVAFNTSYYDFGSIYKNQGDKFETLKVLSNIGNNDNVSVWCSSGDCSKFNDDWIDGTDMIEGEEKDIIFSCIDDTLGNYSAIFSVSSDNSPFNISLELSCLVEQNYGPISGNLITPNAGIIYNTAQNRTFDIIANLSCVGICGEITGYAVYLQNNWWNTDWLYRQRLIINNSINTPSGYQILVELNSSNVGSNFDWSNNGDDLRFINSNSQLDYFIEGWDEIGKSAFVWIKINSAFLSSDGYVVDMYYGNNLAVSVSDVSDVFVEDEIHLTTGRCTDTSNGCTHMDNNDDANAIRNMIGTGTFSIDGSGYVSVINHDNNIYGSDDYYFSRYRTLWIPSSSGTFWFGTASDDGSEAGLWNYDSYGYGFRTPLLLSTHDIVTDWYGGHASGTCGSSGAIERSRSITAGESYWIDYVVEEGTGGQDAQFCIDIGSGYQIFNDVNFGGEFYARNYISVEPTVESINSEENYVVSTSSGNLPFYTLNSQPQYCAPSEDGSCLFNWSLNATGEIGSLHNLSVFFSSNYSSISSIIIPHTTINITKDVIPTINLISPDNSTKIISSNNNVSFKWYVDDDSAILNCSLFVNNMLLKNDNCLSMMNITWNESLSSGKYSWFVNVTDGDNNTIKSDIYDFILIKNYSSQVRKSIRFVNIDQYFIKLNFKNLVESLINFTLLDFVDNSFNYGSFTSLYNFTNVTVGSDYFGEILGWNINDFNNSLDMNINYSIVGLNNNYSITDEFIVGLE